MISQDQVHAAVLNLTAEETVQFMVKKHKPSNLEELVELISQTCFSRNHVVMSINVCSSTCVDAD